MDKLKDLDAFKFYMIVAVILAVVSVWHIYDGWVPQERWLERYPDFPEAWNDFGLYAFYSYNRWTGIILGIASMVCVGVSLHARFRHRQKRSMLDDLTAIRRQQRQ